MIVRYVYPAIVEPDEDGQFIVSFRDVPEALTSGETLEEALAEAVDCLVVALDGYVDERRPRPIPQPSRIRSGEHPIAVPPLIAAKLALHAAMRDARRAPRPEQASRLPAPRPRPSLAHRRHSGRAREAGHADRGHRKRSMTPIDGGER